MTHLEKNGGQINEFLEIQLGPKFERRDRNFLRFSWKKSLLHSQREREMSNPKKDDSDPNVADDTPVVGTAVATTVVGVQAPTSMNMVLNNILNDTISGSSGDTSAPTFGNVTKDGKKTTHIGLGITMDDITTDTRSSNNTTTSTTSPPTTTPAATEARNNTATGHLA